MTFNSIGNIDDISVTEFIYLQDIEKKAVDKYKIKESKLISLVKLLLVVFVTLLIAVITFGTWILTTLCLFVGVL